MSAELNMKFPHGMIAARLDEIGYHHPGTSAKALTDTAILIVNLRRGHLMISRKAIDANGNVGIFTAFKK